MRSDPLAARRAALAALRAVEERGAWSNLAVPDAVGRLADVRDRRFASHLAYETLRWRGTLDDALGRMITRPLTDVEAALLQVLRLGATQLLVSEVPDRAAVDTSVRLAREQVPRGRATAAGGFVNGVLRAVVRTTITGHWPRAEDDLHGHLALATGHPRWVVDDLARHLPPDRLAAVLRADNVAPGVTLRASGDRDGLVAELRELGVPARAGGDPQAVRAPGVDPRHLAAVVEGRATPQDEASMQVVRSTGVRPGARVLDLCAGPGGKTTHLAALAGSSGRVVAVERHPHRADLVRAAARRLGVEVEVLVGDAADPTLGGPIAFDVVLLDAPCTGLGTGRRRPEVRWRRSPDDVRSLAGIQHALLAAAAGRVAVGGILTYAVCTWTCAETVEVADGFEASPVGTDFEPVRRRQWWPDLDDTDGMFVATWRRRGAPADR